MVHKAWMMGHHTPWGILSHMVLLIGLFTTGIRHPRNVMMGHYCSVMLMQHLHMPPPPSKLVVLLNSLIGRVLSTIKAWYNEVNNKWYVVSRWGV